MVKKRKKKVADVARLEIDAAVGAETERRHREHIKYERAYSQQRYRMKRARRRDAVNDLLQLECRHGYLDVGCGRGDMLAAAEALGFAPVRGTEIVGPLIDGARIVYAEVHDLPFPADSFDVATMFDVIEHLVPGDDEKACRELMRVARRHVLLTANNLPSRNKAGDNLHINIRPYEEWDRMFRAWFAPARVTWIKGKRHYVSEAWRIDL